MPNESPFRHVARKSTQRGDIETLFKDLKNRSPKIQALFAHQADILRDYYQNQVSSSDVSLELPTGSGKTLVGLLIAEWRRRTFHERVVYLCPTKQLANQVGQHSADYGIGSRVLTGSKRTYDRQDLALYEKADVLGITTYSGLFNTNPGINDPQIIVLDDAHSSEAYIASMWSVVIRRDENSALYSELLSIFEKDLPTQFVSTLHSKDKPKAQPKPEAVPFGSLNRNLSALRLALNSAIHGPQDSGYFAWIMIQDALIACHVYVSWDEILIRPYIPPTLTHKPFADATQRIYMSATLGRGGELERITGIRNIQRIPTPKTYVSRGIGRRLFLFPDVVAEPDQYLEWVALAAKIVPHTLILCPTNNLDAASRKLLEIHSPAIKLFGARDVEDSIDPFFAEQPSALILANRYDGLDLPNGICRLMVLNGLPAGTNVQESFLEQRLGLDLLLRERIKTRITQAAGRCTRSDTDYVAVIMVGKTLLDFCVKMENRKMFHPELRAELNFSLEQKVEELSDLKAKMEFFLKHDEGWADFEQDIMQLRTEETMDTTFSDILSKVVSDEVDFTYAMWSGDYVKAVELGKNVADVLSDRKLSPYRALWYYFVATAAFSASKTKPEYNAVVIDRLNRAAQACRTVSWFPNAIKSMQPESDFRASAGELETIAMEGIVDVLMDLGPTGSKFLRKIEEVKQLVTSTDSKNFDAGIEGLGLFLGFDSWRPATGAEPDCVWQLNGELALLFEGKSEESPDGPVSVENCRQAAGHLKWATAQERLKNCKEIFSILITPRDSIDIKALPQADNIYAVKTTEIKPLFDKVVHMLTVIRSSMTNTVNEELREKVLQEMISRDLTPESIRRMLLSKPATTLPQF